jgi:hypothetical protein
MFKVPLAKPQGRYSRGWNTIEGVYEPVGNDRNFPNHDIESLGRTTATFVYTPNDHQYRGRNRILKQLTGTTDPTTLVPSFPGQAYLNTTTGITWNANTFTFPPGLTASSWVAEGGGGTT